MKKLIALTALLALILSSLPLLAHADEGNEEQQTSPRTGLLKISSDTISVKNETDHAVWITIYNTFDSIRDYGCLKPGDCLLYTSPSPRD